MPTMDVFKNDAFSSTSLTTFVNKQDFVPGYIGKIAGWYEHGVSTTTVGIEEKNTTLGLIQTSPRGAPPPQDTVTKRVMRQLNIPRIAKSVTILADSVQNVRPFGSETELQSMETVAHERVTKMLSEIDLTLESLRLGAFRGLILDADGSTLYNLFTEFNVTQEAEVDFMLDDANADIEGICRTVRRTMRKNLKLPNDGGFKIVATCSDEFFDAIKSHAKVVAAYDRFMAFHPGENINGFPFAGIWFENYQGTDDGTSVAVAANKVHLAPVGISGLWETVYAPADAEPFINTTGLPRYVLNDPENKNSARAIHFEVQTNALPFCTRPKVLMKGKKF